MGATRLEGLYYALELDAASFDKETRRVEKIVADLGKTAVSVPVTADAGPIQRVEKAFRELEAAQRKSTGTTDQGAKAAQAAATAAARHERELQRLAATAIKESEALRKAATAEQLHAQSMGKAEVAAYRMNAAIEASRATLSTSAPASQQAATGVAGLAASFRGLAGAAVTYKAVQYTREAIQLADAYTNMRSRLSLVTTGTENLNAVQEKLFAVSQNTRSEMGANVALYTSLARSTKALGLSQDQLVSITKTVGQAFLISGASATETSAAVRQLGQALASGVLRGDEFNSIAENAPRLQQAVADSLGVTIGELRKYAEEGKITAQVVTEALLKAGASIDSESKAIALTVGGAMTQVKNSLLLAVGEFDKASGASAALAKALSDLTKSSEEDGKKIASFAESFGYLTKFVTESAKALLGHSITLTGVLLPGLGLFRKGQDLVRDGYAGMTNAANAFFDGRNGIVAPKAPTLSGLFDNTVFTPFGEKGRSSTAAAPKGAPDQSAIQSAAKGAAEAAKDFDTAAKSIRDYGAALGTTRDPVQDAIARNKAVVASLEALIPKLEKTKQAAARDTVKTIAAQLADDVERLRTVKLEELTKKYDEFSSAISRSATGEVTVAYKKRIDELLEMRKALAGAGAAQQVWQSVLDEAELRKEQQELEALTDQQTAYERALKVVGIAQQQSNAEYEGQTISVTQYKASLATLETTQAALKLVVESGTLSTIAQAKAEALLVELIGRRKQLEGNRDKGPAKPIKEAVDQSSLLVAGLLAASNAAGDLANRLGESGTKLGQLASAGIKLSQILKAASAAQEVGKSTTASSAQKLSAKTDVFALVIGGAIELAGALDLFGTKAAERAKQMRAAAAEFNRALDEFAVVERSGLQEQLRQNLKNADDLVGRAAESVGFKSAGAGSNFQSQSAADVQKEIDALRAAAVNAASTGGGAGKKLAGSLNAFADQLQRIADEVLKNEQRLKEANDQRNADATDDLRVRSLIAQGRTEEAAALRVKLEQDRAILEAAKDQSESGKSYLAYLQKVQKEETAAADAYQRDPLKEFANRAKLFGISGADYLDGLVTATTAKFGKLFTGIDLSTQDGIDALKATISAKYAEFFADGVISEQEQSVLDALFNIFSTAADVFDSLAERVQRALSKVDDDNAILGGNQRAQFGRTLDASKGFNGVLDDILGSVDLSTSAGAESFRTNLQGLYTNLLQDGLTEEETVIVGLIKGLLSGLGNATDEAQQEVEANIAKKAAERARKRQSGSNLTAVTDAEGAEAFANFLASLAPAITDFFGAVDTSSAAGITDAKTRLVEFFKTIDGMSEQGVFDKFDLTKDEFLDAMLAIDSGLDGLASTAQSAADAILNTAARLSDLTADVGNESLRLTGNDRQADINESQQRTNQKVIEAKALGASQSIIDTIVANGLLSVKSINDRYDQQAAAAVARDPAAVGAAGSPSTEDSRSEFVASAVKNISSVQAIRIDGLLQSQLIVQRRMLDLMLAGEGQLPTLRVPALPAGLGTFTGPVTFQTQVHITAGSGFGPDMTRADLDAFGRKLAPVISQAMRQRASGLTALSGGRI